MPDLNSLIDSVASFHQFYERFNSQLSRSRSKHPLSNAELRILYELGKEENLPAGRLAAVTGTDPGYLTRILRSLEKQELVIRQPSRQDGRSFSVMLTTAAKQLLQTLEMEAKDDITALLTGLSDKQQEQLTTAMGTVQQVLSGENTPNGAITFRQQLLPGDVGYLIHLHGELYAREMGYNLEFEGHVCKTFHEMLATYSLAKDRVFLAISGGKIVGSVAVLGSTRYLAQLRWFLVHPDFRGKGLGKKLLSDAIAFCKEKNYQTVYLMTTSMQTTAITLYKQLGFRKSGEKLLQQWGQQLYEQRYDLDLV
ncbi:bifunctional helix-turn-helix transcriptional regulator/GNAT family N-acetyltransferase [Chitinophaga sp. Cy-1792]|uniref:bifunctional helix-turn-helix transcriptional regulator/GNAT family N-acetyltransferase n=1 Tax=Chitinophaga sp. Cy-1792 TaxID=2608339 RepID=UPI001421CCC1|nr:bifunctional helix-turn-helix transcriptional regulator/GNAT family N-acetyltransferase [Chitinophaga sp. Cy-1792]NIG56359.1 GNAT family N-acetyltransferase [Chitinophaga sp. Cy-1792]